MVEQLKELYTQTLIELRITKTSHEYTRYLLREKIQETEDYKTQQDERYRDLEQELWREQRISFKQELHIRKLYAEINSLRTQKPKVLHKKLITFTVKHRMLQNQLIQQFKMQQKSHQEKRLITFTVKHRVFQNYLKQEFKKPQKNLSEKKLVSKPPPAYKGQQLLKQSPVKNAKLSLKDNNIVHQKDTKIRRLGEEVESIKTLLHKTTKNEERARNNLLLVRKQNAKLIQEKEELKKQLQKEAQSSAKQYRVQVNRRLSPVNNHKTDHKNSEEKVLTSRLEQMEKKNKELTRLLSKEIEISLEHKMKIDHLTGQLKMKSSLFRIKYEREQSAADKLLLQRKHDITKLQNILNNERKEFANTKRTLMMEIQDLRVRCNKYSAEKTNLPPRSRPVQKKEYEKLKTMYDEQQLKMKENDEVIKSMSQIVDQSSQIVERVSKHHRNCSFREKPVQKHAGKVVMVK